MNSNLIYHLNPATRENCPQIRELASQIWEPTYGEILSAEQLEYMFEWMYSIDSLTNQMNSGHAFFIAYENDDPVGYMSIEKENDCRYHLQKIYILPSYQGKGLGRFLIREAEVLTRKKQPYGLLELVLNVNRNNKAFHFYEKMGFIIESQGDFDIGNGYYMNDYIMVKQISPL